MVRKKILYIIDTLETGGAEKSLLEISSMLKEWQPIVVAIYKGGTLKPEFKNAGIAVYSLNITKKFGIFEGIRKISSIIQKEKPNLIHAFLFKSEQFSRWVGPKYNIPVINSFVNDSYSPERFKMLSLKSKITLNLYKHIDRLFAHRVTQYMSLTHAILENNIKALNIDPIKVQIIPRGRNIEKLRNAINITEVAGLKKNFAKGPIILTVSRLLKRKGYLESIAAMEIVVKERPLVQYLIAGEGHDRKIFEDLICEKQLQDNIFLLGNRKDVPNLLRIADIFLFPSHYEGQGGALIEAMIMGKIIIAPRIPVIKESVEDKLSAILYEPCNVSDMAAKIASVLDNIDKPEIISLGYLARQKAENEFKIEKVVAQHEQMYNNILCR